MCLARAARPCESTVRTQTVESLGESGSVAVDGRCVFPNLESRGTALLVFSGIDFWSSPKGHKAGLGLLDWFSMLTQQARPCLVYKLILYYFQVPYETEPGKSFLQDCWIFSCVVLFWGAVEAGEGHWEVTESNSFSLPNFVFSHFKMSSHWENTA